MIKMNEYDKQFYNLDSEETKNVCDFLNRIFSEPKYDAYHSNRTDEIILDSMSYDSLVYCVKIIIKKLEIIRSENKQLINKIL